jgi:hypothetical protein
MGNNINKSANNHITDKAFKALKEAVVDVIATHKKLGLPLYVDKNGKIMAVSPHSAKISK